MSIIKVRQNITTEYEYRIVKIENWNFEISMVKIQESKFSNFYFFNDYNYDIMVFFLGYCRKQHNTPYEFLRYIEERCTGLISLDNAILFILWVKTDQKLLDIQESYLLEKKLIRYMTSVLIQKTYFWVMLGNMDFYDKNEEMLSLPQVVDTLSSKKFTLSGYKQVIELATWKIKNSINQKKVRISLSMNQHLSQLNRNEDQILYHTDIVSTSCYNLFKKYLKISNTIIPIKISNFKELINKLYLDKIFIENIKNFDPQYYIQIKSYLEEMHMHLIFIVLVEEKLKKLNDLEIIALYQGHLEKVFNCLDNPDNHSKDGAINTLNVFTKTKGSRILEMLTMLNNLLIHAIYIDNVVTAIYLKIASKNL